ncbi:bifunctional DNA-formamidopyrimidine glycosylase/DNA-(apurinic or apyrimidinic site) lyase [Neomegalonema perideroedes]|uniref:bifunctional DNA-formamidopyrimidine glycosylase/DNA-(apurinic or apyrimidinic site) lyase n=1 Tax=Neomegalonema perideroedes TaxID=217219 RepID=UPI000372D396|nr:bifunctional DNA-formamidopyrimidine glycosylase/DNA-(apurinic or apyrimidinic site) lyase [Neomegalonema perideroedes]
MPEAPEIETIRLGLAPELTGRRLEKALTRRPDLRKPFPKDFAARLAGRRVEEIGRRSKYLLLGLSGGETLLIHLGMSGRLILKRSNGPEPLGAFHHEAGQGAGGASAHDHVVFWFEGGLELTYNDARRFGMMDLHPTASLGEHAALKSLGPEPMTPGFSGAELLRRVGGARGPIKTLILDQSRLAGVGNIYACEALWRAGIAPERRGVDLKPAEAEALARDLGEVMRESVRAGGSTLRDYRRADGEIGGFQDRFAVYDRAGEACPRCGGRIARLVQAGRSTFWCPGCQS